MHSAAAATIALPKAKFGKVTWKIYKNNAKKVLSLTFDAPLFGVWSPASKKAPFVCIEPWYGRCDRVGFSKKLEDREYGTALRMGEEFITSYDIKVF